ncbi:MAG: glycosyl transferase [Deltaproteobacteria bacterium]|nr:glycosyl transferase [Deltaproteobacteria bacterium]
MPQLVYPFLSFFLCLALTPVVRALARRRGWLANPSADRWHERPTALLGGIAIFTAMAVPLVLLSDFPLDFLFAPAAISHGRDAATGAALLFGAGAMFLWGLVDDFVHIKPYTKLLGQILAASAIAFFGYRLQWVESLTADTLLTILWMVGITNALNLLDNMDGLCAGVGAIAALLLSVLLRDAFPLASLYALLLAGAALAFLVYNFRPASIFMGDSGSLTIGFSLAFLSVVYSHFAAPAHSLHAIAVPLLVLMVPIFDTTLVTIIRTLSGRKASVGGKDHTSHRLVLIGLSQTKAVLLLYAATAVFGVAGLFVHRTDAFTSPTVIAPVGMAVVLMGIYLAQLRVYPEKEFSALRDKAFSQVLWDLTYKRQLLLVLFDFLLVSFSYYLSYRLRFSGEVFVRYFPIFLRSLPAVIVCKYVAFFLTGLYRGMWGQVSAPDLWGYVKSTMLGTLLSVVVVTFVYRFEDFSKGIFLIDWLLLTGLIAASRGSFRLFSDAVKRGALSGDRVVLFGAGRGGEVFLREVLNNPGLGIKPLGFVDDDPLKAGKKLQGFPILGTSRDLPGLVEKMGVQGIVVTFANPGPGVADLLRGLSRESGVFVKRFSVRLADLEEGGKRGLDRA